VSQSSLQKTWLDPQLAGEAIAADPGAIPGAAVCRDCGNPGETLVNGPPELEDYVETLNDGGSQGGMRVTGPAGKVIGDYEILSELGRGGMGVVYKARHRILKRTVALKMILAGAHSSGPALQRFLAEARAGADLQHPGIVQIFDMGQQDGLPWFSLEFVDGSDLQKTLDGKPRDARSAASLVQTVCRAMQYAHYNGILDET
jgi:serine/threonine-protein kinase